VDTQHVLPFGTPEQVRRQVLERCRIFSRNGGFVFNTIHNVQARTPVENMVALLEAVHEFNGVPICRLAELSGLHRTVTPLS
jgi:uroporphyrinogen-III decarboxylase